MVKAPLCHRARTRIIIIISSHSWALCASSARTLRCADGRCGYCVCVCVCAGERVAFSMGGENSGARARASVSCESARSPKLKWPDGGQRRRRTIMIFSGYSAPNLSALCSAVLLLLLLLCCCCCSAALSVTYAWVASAFGLRSDMRACVCWLGCLGFIEPVKHALELCASPGTTGKLKITSCACVRVCACVSITCAHSDAQIPSIHSIRWAPPSPSTLHVCLENCLPGGCAWVH